MNDFALVRNSAWTISVLIFLVIAGIVSSSAIAQTPQVLFPVAQPLPLSGSALPEYAGDFNGDGVPDLAYITEGNLLEVVLGAGTNAPVTVTTQLSCPSNAGQAQMAFADVNHDEKLDLVFSCNGYITIQLGNGDGTFQTPAYFAINTQTPVLVDLNGDGFPDIAALVPSDSTAPQVAVLLNAGSTSPGVFQSPKLYALPPGSNGLLAGDFNGDGKQDILTATLNSNPVTASYTAFSVLYGKGDGTFNTATTQAANFSSFTVGDFNGDGNTDLALLLLPATNTSLSTSVQLLLGSNSGTFSQGALLGVTATPAPYSLGTEPMAAVALTPGGGLDLVVVTNVLQIFAGDGKGDFTPSGSYAVTGSVDVADGPLLFADLTGDGNPGLILGNSYGTFYFPGKGDGTLQAAPGSPVTGPIADVNNDGIADIVFTSPQGGNYFGTALGRGDGTFAILDQTTPLPASVYGDVLMTGDFNGDGKIDTIAIQPGTTALDACGDPPNAQLLAYLGTGDGGFQAVGTALALGVRYAVAGISGDFNGDGKLDLILPYGVSVCQQGPGLVFVPGKGDGTFGTPVDLNASQDNVNPGLLVADLNNDKKLDFVWGDAVFLGNGDGTFKQIPLTIPASPAGPIALMGLADLNGDGIPDAVSSPGTILYAGNGDGTFQTTPFYTVPLPQYTYAQSFATADVNGDGNPDLLLVEDGAGASFLGVYLGDGTGGFVQDTNTYYVSPVQSSLLTNAIVAARLNNQASPLASDKQLDVLITANNGGASYVASLLNQTNPSAVKPAPIMSRTVLVAYPGAPGDNVAFNFVASIFGTNPKGSVTFTANGNSLGTAAVTNGSATLSATFATAGSYAITASYSGDSNNSPSTSTATGFNIGQTATATTLQVSPGAGNVNAQITLTATVSGSSPTGAVSFATGATKLGTATLGSGVATLKTSFSAAGSYPVVATYAGDANNVGSASQPVTVVIAAPDFTVAGSPTSGSVKAGQMATFTFTVTPSGGYAGTVNFSCGTLPGLASCAFAPASVTPSGSGAVSSTLTVTTAAATAMVDPKSPWIPAGGLALAGMIGLGFLPRRIGRWHSLRMLGWGLFLFSLSLSVLGCGGGNNTPSTPGTPAGSYTISVNASDSSGGPQHAVSITLSVQ